MEIARHKPHHHRIHHRSSADHLHYHNVPSVSACGTGSYCPLLSTLLKWNKIFALFFKLKDSNTVKILLQNQTNGRNCWIQFEVHIINIWDFLLFEFRQFIVKFCILDLKIMLREVEGQYFLFEETRLLWFSSLDF